MRISYWSSYVCSSDLQLQQGEALIRKAKMAGDLAKDANTIVADDHHDLGFINADIQCQPLAAGVIGRVVHHLGKAVVTRLKHSRRHAGQQWHDVDRKSTRLNSSHYCASRMPSST